MSQINVSHLTFSYEGSYDPIFEDVSFQMDTNWKLGFTGRNGRGKTTFLQLLLGRYEYSGQISSSVSFEYFPYPVSDLGLPAASIAENLCPDYQEWKLSRELSMLEIPEDVLQRPFRTLSNGERAKILLAILFLKENHFLLIDEPTNHLDLHGREVVSRYLNKKRGFILVSHDRAFLDGCVDHILSINRSSIDVRRGNFSTWLADKERQDNFELAENEKLKKEINRLADAARRTEHWSDKVEKTKNGVKNSGSKPDKGYIGHKSAKMMKRSKTIENRRGEAIEEKSKLLKDLEKTDPLKISRISYHSNRLLTFDDVSILYGEKPACQHVSFSIYQGNRLALCGKNGSGKSSILKLILGEDLAYTGTLQKGSQLRISYVPQDTSFLEGSLSAFISKHEIEESLFKAILRKLDFSRDQFEKDLHEYSSGQKKKVLIAKSLCEKAHLLIWDEPLNFIDILSREQIEKLLLTYEPTILFVEHDAVFLDKIATAKVLL